jgi:hypothetical protein
VRQELPQRGVAKIGVNVVGQFRPHIQRLGVPADEAILDQQRGERRRHGLGDRSHVPAIFNRGGRPAIRGTQPHHGALRHLAATDDDDAHGGHILRIACPFDQFGETSVAQRAGGRTRWCR